MSYTFIFQYHQIYHPRIIGAILIEMQLSVEPPNQYRDQLHIPVGCWDADNADDAVVQFMLSLAIFSTSHPSVQVQRINSTEKLALSCSAHMLPPAQCRANESWIHSVTIIIWSVCVLRTNPMGRFNVYFGLIVLLILFFTFYFSSFYCFFKPLESYKFTIWKKKQSMASFS